MTDLRLVEMDFTTPPTAGEGLVYDSTLGLFVPYELGVTYQGVGSGAGYALTNAYALLNQGTTDPQIVITEPGTYLLQGWVACHANAATFAAARIVYFKTRRTNNTPADVGYTTSAYARIMTLATETIFIGQLIPYVYTTANTDDALELQGYVSVVPSAGSADVTFSALTALRVK